MHISYLRTVFLLIHIVLLRVLTPLSYELKVLLKKLEDFSPGSLFKHGRKTTITVAKRLKKMVDNN